VLRLGIFRPREEQLPGRVPVAPRALGPEHRRQARLLREAEGNHGRVAAGRCVRRIRNSRTASNQPGFPDSLRSVHGPSQAAFGIRGTGLADGSEPDETGSPQNTHVGSQMVDLAPHCPQFELMATSPRCENEPSLFSSLRTFRNRPVLKILVAWEANVALTDGGNRTHPAPRPDGGPPADDVSPFGG